MAVAVKLLHDSKQGRREFLAELTAISGIVHENLITLVGCCCERSHRILVYNYLENKSLADKLLGDSDFLFFVILLSSRPFNTNYYETCAAWYCRIKQ
jgi:hypothetical protein